MNQYSKVTDAQKDGKIYLLAIPEKRIGPWLGYFWKNGNCWLQCDAPAHGYTPTHYFSLEGLMFEQ